MSIFKNNLLFLLLWQSLFFPVSKHYFMFKQISCFSVIQKLLHEDLRVSSGICIFMFSVYLYMCESTCVHIYACRDQKSTLSVFPNPLHFTVLLIYLCFRQDLTVYPWTDWSSPQTRLTGLPSHSGIHLPPPLWY